MLSLSAPSPVDLMRALGGYNASMADSVNRDPQHERAWPEM